VIGHLTLDLYAQIGVLIRQGVTADISCAFADCPRLRHQHHIRHLRVVGHGKAIAVVSICELLNESVNHHAKTIVQLERERMTMFASTTSSEARAASVGDRGQPVL
jgi:hypothetical protein